MSHLNAQQRELVAIGASLASSCIPCIKFHVRNILDKLHLHNRAEVVGFALRNRMVASVLED